MSAIENHQKESMPPDFQKNEILDCVVQAIKELPSLAKRKGITSQQTEALYTLGFQLYHAECYQQAADIFRLLCFYESANSRNWLALGGAYQHTKSHDNALAAFAMASIQDSLDPEPKFYAAHSLIGLGDLPLALKCAETAVELCENRHDKKNIYKHATVLRNAIAAQINIKPTNS